MSIRFRCPRCKTVYTVGRGDQGKKAECKVCGQWVEVPELPAAKPVLGELLPDEGNSAGPSLDDLSRAAAKRKKKADEAPYRDWMVAGETLTPELKAEIHRHWRALGINRHLTDPPTEEYYDPNKHGH